MSEAALNMEMESSMNRTHEESIRLRPAATSALYDPKAAEFKEWCCQKNFPSLTKFTVTEAKLHLFLEECVIGRKRKKDKSNEKRVGYQTVLAYVAAITDLWKQQQIAGINAFPNPRGNTIKALLKNAALRNESIKRSNHEDRGIGTMLDVVSSVDDLKNVIKLINS